MSPEEVKDPVCGMTIEKESASGSSEYEGKTYYFCSPGCLEKFEQAPQAYVGKEAGQG